MGLLDGRVAIITGAGNGLGKAYALAMAAEGASVVVNDLGVARDGNNAAAGPADEVVAQIRAAGGKAVANNGNVATEEGADAIRAAAIDAFGRIDVLVNNAGILRDKTFVKMTREMWDAVIQVHLTGTYLVTKACLPHLMERGGSVINTSSLAGLKGNYGQSNYGAAKAGIWGLSQVLAMELGRAKIRVNCVAPVAKTRMTEELDMVAESWTPEMVAPMVVFLASDLAADVTGRCFGCHGPELLEYRMTLTPGATKEGGVWTPTEIAARLDEIAATGAQAGASTASDGDGDDNTAFIQEIFARFGEAFLPEKAGDWSAVLVFDIVGYGAHTVRVNAGSVTVEDGAAQPSSCVITFASSDVFAGVVRGEQSADKAFMAGKIKANNMGELMKFAQFFDLSRASNDGTARVAGEAPSASAVGRRYRAGAVFAEPEHIAAYALATLDESARYRLGPDQVVPPLFAVRALHHLAGELLNDPELNADLARLVHGEQDMTFLRPIRPWDVLTPRGEILSVEEKSTGYLIRSAQRLLVDGDPVVEATAGYFVRKASPEARANASSTPATTSAPQGAERVRARFTLNADLIPAYAHASGDHNPIHLDDTVAKAAGLPGVIGHGLWTMGVAQNLIIQQLCDGDPSRLQRLKVRFSKMVRPGDELTLIGHDDGMDAGGATRINFTVMRGTDDPIIVGGVAEIRA